MDEQYVPLARLVKAQAGAESAIVIILKGNDSGLAFDLSPEMKGFLPEILQSSARQCVSDLAVGIKRNIQPVMRKKRK